MQETMVDLNVFKTWKIGSATITRVLELPPMDADPAIFIQANKAAILEHRSWLCPDFAREDGSIILNFQAFIIEAAGKRIIVDPCIGNNKERSIPNWNMLETPFLQRLERAGYPRETIDYVLCTHLHLDHCGWNTMLVDGKWLPTFPNARYMFTRAEYESARMDDQGNGPVVFADSIQPIVEAGLADLVDPGHVIVDGVHLESTPGHTPGHCAVIVSSEGQEAIITGDLLHHPVQVALPDISDNFCWNSELARATRRTILERVSNRGALMLGSHFSGPTGVYLKPSAEAWTVEITGAIRSEMPVHAPG